MPKKYLPLKGSAAEKIFLKKIAEEKAMLQELVKKQCDLPENKEPIVLCLTGNSVRIL